jgi:hypothetical protein
MSQRLCRKFTSRTFTVDGQLCKVFLEPIEQHQPGFWVWNVGFAIGKSRRQLNDWYYNRKNKRARSLTNQLVGKSGMKAIKRGFEEVLKLRWNLPPGDCLKLDCTSGDPARQFHAWSRWHRYHPEWVISCENREFYWYRPPYPDDSIWESIKGVAKIKPITPADPLANTAGINYFQCFDLIRVDARTLRSTAETNHQSSQALSID